MKIINNLITTKKCSNLQPPSPSPTVRPLVCSNSLDKKFGAEWGVGVGMTGQCYAIPTMHGGIDAIKPYVDDFIAYAKEHNEFHFLVTRIGCGIAGFTDEQMAPLFKELLELSHVSLPKVWIDILKE